jgi:hypothetical protein
MFRFLMGVIVGAVAAIWFERANARGDLDRRFLEAQERANGMLAESRRTLEEVRQEMASALETTRRSVEEQADRMRRAADGERE